MEAIVCVTADCTNGAFTPSKGLAVLAKLVAALEDCSAGTCMGGGTGKGQIHFDLLLPEDPREIELRFDAARRDVARIFGELAADWEYTITPAF